MSANFMEITFPDRYDYAAALMDRKFGDIENAEGIPDLTKLALYALRKQIENGPCKESAPYMWNVKERYKHDAWKQLESVSKFEAMVKYVEILEGVVGRNWLDEAICKSPTAIAGIGEDRSSLTNGNGGTAATTSATSEERSLATSGQDENKAHTPVDPSAPTRCPSLNVGVPEDVESLKGEVLRLRRLLEHHGIDPATGNIVEEEDEVSATTDGTGGPSRSHPCEPFASATPPAPSAHMVHHQVVRLASEEIQPVYYSSSPKKLGWLEWFGFGNNSGDSSNSNNTVTSDEPGTPRQQRTPLRAQGSFNGPVTTTSSRSEGTGSVSKENRKRTPTPPPPLQQPQAAEAPTSGTSHQEQETIAPPLLPHRTDESNKHISI